MISIEGYMVSIEQTIKEVQELHTNCTHKVIHIKQS